MYHIISLLGRHADGLQHRRPFLKHVCDCLGLRTSSIYYIYIAIAYMS